MGKNMALGLDLAPFPECIPCRVSAFAPDQRSIDFADYYDSTKCT